MSNERATIALRLDRVLHREATAVADVLGVSLTDFIAEAVTAAVMAAKADPVYAEKRAAAVARLRTEHAERMRALGEEP